MHLVKCWKKIRSSFFPFFCLLLWIFVVRMGKLSFNTLISALLNYQHQCPKLHGRTVWGQLAFCRIGAAKRKKKEKRKKLKFPTHADTLHRSFDRDMQIHSERVTVAVSVAVVHGCNQKKIIFCSSLSVTFPVWDKHPSQAQQSQPLKCVRVFGRIRLCVHVQWISHQLLAAFITREIPKTLTKSTHEMTQHGRASFSPWPKFKKKKKSSEYAYWRMSEEPCDLSTERLFVQKMVKVIGRKESEAID